MESAKNNVYSVDVWLLDTIRHRYTVYPWHGHVFDSRVFFFFQRSVRNISRASCNTQEKINKRSHIISRLSASNAYSQSVLSRFMSVPDLHYFCTRNKISFAGNGSCPHSRGKRRRDLHAPRQVAHLIARTFRSMVNSPLSMNNSCM